MLSLNPDFWFAQIFWLIFIFGVLYIVVWKLALPRITDGIENRKKHVIEDLDEAEKLKKSAEKKLLEYNKIIENSKNEAKKIIADGRKKLENNIHQKRKKFEKEIEDELVNAEKQIKNFKRSSIDNINKIALETSDEIIKKILSSEINKSNLTAIIEEISKKESKEYL